MPWVGILDDSEVIPEAVPDRTDVECPDCRGRMRPRGPMDDGRARHFFHIDNVGGGGGAGGAGGGTCSPGESSTHRKLKSLAVSRLRREFAGNIADVGPEVAVDAPESDAEQRRADAFVKFEERDEQLGSGVIIEVQYRNEGKDIEATMDDYVAQDFAVVWADEDDFTDDRCLLGEQALRRRARKNVWPDRGPCSHEVAHKYGTQHSSSLIRNHFVDNTVSREVSVPARVPDEWFDEKSIQLWRETDWSIRFTPSEEKRWMLPTTGYEPTLRRGGNTRIPVTLPEDCIHELASEIERDPDKTPRPPAAWTHDHSRTPYENLRNMVEEIPEPQRHEDYIAMLASRWIAGASTPMTRRALERMKERGEV